VIIRVLGVRLKPHGTRKRLKIAWRKNKSKYNTEEMNKSIKSNYEFRKGR
jgi:hypothetical protein